jgi:hypothetical protein
VNGWALNAADVGPLGAVLVALVIHFFMRSRRPTGMPPPPSPVPDTRVPLEDAQLAGQLREVAGRMGLPERVLPRAHPPTGDGDFVWQEGDTWRYQSIERGGPVADHTHASLAEVFFALFRDRTRMHAYLATIGMEEPAREAEIGKRQKEMLAAGDPEWAGWIDEGK